MTTGQNGATLFLKSVADNPDLMLELIEQVQTQAEDEDSTQEKKTEAISKWFFDQGYATTLEDVQSALNEFKGSFSQFVGTYQTYYTETEDNIGPVFNLTQENDTLTFWLLDSTQAGYRQIVDVSTTISSEDQHYQLSWTDTSTNTYGELVFDYALDVTENKYIGPYFKGTYAFDPQNKEINIWGKVGVYEPTKIKETDYLDSASYWNTNYQAYTFLSDPEIDTDQTPTKLDQLIALSADLNGNMEVKYGSDTIEAPEFAYNQVSWSGSNDHYARFVLLDQRYKLNANTQLGKIVYGKWWRRGYAAPSFNNLTAYDFSSISTDTADSSTIEISKRASTTNEDIREALEGVNAILSVFVFSTSALVLIGKGLSAVFGGPSNSEKLKSLLDRSSKILDIVESKGIKAVIENPQSQVSNRQEENPLEDAPDKPPEADVSGAAESSIAALQEADRKRAEEERERERKEKEIELERREAEEERERERDSEFEEPL